MKILSLLWTIVCMNILKTILDILFPLPDHIRAIEHISREELLRFSELQDISPDRNIYPLFKYKSQNPENARKKYVDHAIWALKYHKSQETAELLAALLYGFMVEVLSDKILFDNFTDPLLIPLPISEERRRERGYNQTELLAHEIMKQDIQKILTLRTDILQKVRHTAPQATLSRTERLENLRNCFSVAKPEAVKNKNVILLDDVTTTGSTIKEAMRVLEAAGAKNVIAFTVAH